MSLEAAVGLPATTSKQNRLKSIIGKRRQANIAHPAAAEITGTHLERGRTQFQEFMKGL